MWGIKLPPFNDYAMIMDFGRGYVANVITVMGGCNEIPNFCKSFCHHNLKYSHVFHSTLDHLGFE
jgi:hypothetical protein